jgi:hypothetical protein
MPKPKVDHAPTRISELPEDSYIFRPGRTLNAKEQRIIDAYKKGTPVSALVLKWAIAPGTVVRLLGLDPVKDDKLIAEAQAAFGQLRQVITDARCDF